jgi:hypothetical protein
VDHHPSPVSEEVQNRIIKRKVKREKKENLTMITIIEPFALCLKYYVIKSVNQYSFH